MASNQDFVDYVSEQLSGAGAIRYKKMFGEYGLYCDEIYFGGVCDNQLFVKITDEGRKLLQNPEEAPPYSGAKLHFRIEDLEDVPTLVEFVKTTCANLPAPKKKK